ncbi:Hint domain-containing protein [Pseudofrankia sp. BMG5.36]|uniref:Hint domain-containing protein n=1 Tax=Pseudofrankia sp. BMG5.36 TaxID=1834512 RepID=UPI0009F3878E|nr:Hint domain-containing protein [Pseudofrankia sp. BMG5.36]
MNHDHAPPWRTAKPQFKGRNSSSGTVQGEGAAARAGDDLVHACSFAGATPVLMADGTTKPIDQIHAGDQVLATNPETGEQAAKTVVHVWVHNDTLTDLLFADGTVLTTTEDHPFWSATDHRFERADQLASGEKLLRADGREATSIRPRARDQPPGTRLQPHRHRPPHVLCTRRKNAGPGSQHRSSVRCVDLQGASQGGDRQVAERWL